MRSQWMSSEQAAAALGVRLPTLYAYVSRGVISRELVMDSEGQRVSRFQRDEVLALVQARSRPRAGAWALLIESDVTQLDASGRLAFRGVDVADCAGWGFERTACHVLGLRDRAWLAHSEAGASGAGRATDTIRLTVMRLAAQDEFREQIDPDHCRSVASSAVEASTVALTGLREGTVAQRLARAWAPDAPDEAWYPAVTQAIDTALSVLVDHELTASTIAARAAAGVRADPWMVLLAGLAAMSGPFQAGAGRAAAAALREWEAGRTMPLAPVPGFGHKVYVGPDPRAVLLLDHVAAVCSSTAESINDFAIQMARVHSLHPNIDAALGGLILAADLPDDAGEVIFTLARIPGLMAHALEEYPHGLRLRPRALA
ncbi:citrate synthase [Streptomyces sp. NPDC055721]|uniref:citrate synthase n=1 Tax=Streptomyces sp. NPDC127132 TaxID=3345374 RepID=UPI00363E119A